METKESPSKYSHYYVDLLGKFLVYHCPTAGEKVVSHYYSTFHRCLDEIPIHPGREAGYQDLSLDTKSWFITFRTWDLLLQVFLDTCFPAVSAFFGAMLSL